MFREKIGLCMQELEKRKILHAVDAVLRYRFGEAITWSTADRLIGSGEICVSVGGISGKVTVRLSNGHVVGISPDPGAGTAAENREDKEVRSGETDTASFFYARRPEKCLRRRKASPEGEAGEFLAASRELLLEKTLEARREGWESVSLPGSGMNESTAGALSVLLRREGYCGCRLRRGKVIVALREEGMAERPKRKRKHRKEADAGRPEAFLKSIAANYISDNFGYLVRIQEKALQGGRNSYVINTGLARDVLPFLCRELVETHGYASAVPGRGDAVVVKTGKLTGTDEPEDEMKFDGNTVSDEELESVPFAD